MSYQIQTPQVSDEAVQEEKYEREKERSNQTLKNRGVQTHIKPRDMDERSHMAQALTGDTRRWRRQA